MAHDAPQWLTLVAGFSYQDLMVFFFLGISSHSLHYSFIVWEKKTLKRNRIRKLTDYLFVVCRFLANDDKHTKRASCSHCRTCNLVGFITLLVDTIFFLFPSANQIYRRYVAKRDFFAVTWFRNQKIHRIFMFCKTEIVTKSKTLPTWCDKIVGINETRVF